MSDTDDQPSPPAYQSGPEPVTPASLTGRPDGRGGPGRGGWPGVALFVGGFLTCLGLALSALALSGTIRPVTTAGGAGATPTPTASHTASAASPTTPPLVTPVPIVAPAAFTPTALADGNGVGSKTAKVTVEVWADYQCPYCQRFTAQVAPQLVSTYVATGKVRLVFRDLPFLGEESYWASIAAALAQRQGKFWPYHDYLFANQLGENVGSFSIPRLQAMADAVGLDRTTFDAGLQIDAARTLFSEIKQASAADASKLDISSTPTVVVAGKVIKGSDWASVKAAIDATLAAA